MIATEEREPMPATLPGMVNDMYFFSTDGSKYILDLEQLQSPEDIIKVLKHFSTRVELRVHETIGIEAFVKPISDTVTH